MEAQHDMGVMVLLRVMHRRNRRVVPVDKTPHPCSNTATTPLSTYLRPKPPQLRSESGRS
jgi:hypothetical protein